MPTTHELVTIWTKDLPKAVATAREIGLVIDRMYGGKSVTMQVGARKAGPMGNHEPRWNEAQRMVFTMAMGA